MGHPSSHSRLTKGDPYRSFGNRVSFPVPVRKDAVYATSLTISLLDFFRETRSANLCGLFPLLKGIDPEDMQ